MKLSRKAQKICSEFEKQTHPAAAAIYKLEQELFQFYLQNDAQ